MMKRITAIGLVLSSAACAMNRGEETGRAATDTVVTTREDTVTTTREVVDTTTRQVEDTALVTTDTTITVDTTMLEGEAQEEGPSITVDTTSDQ